MKKSRFTEEQMVSILREADLSPVAEVVRRQKLSEQSIHTWRRRFGTLEPADLKRLRDTGNSGIFSVRTFAFSRLCRADSP